MNGSLAKPALLDTGTEELTQLLRQWGEAPYRAAQVRDTLPKALRERLAEHFRLGGARIVESRDSALDDTRKFLFELDDGNLIEGVLMRYHHGNTLCVSTQVGCRMGCAFCASTRGGLIRNLTPGEMLGQVLSAGAAVNSNPQSPVGAAAHGGPQNAGEPHNAGGPQIRPIDNLVLMGSGEPLDNYDNVLAFLRRVTAPAPEGLGISARNISLSTCGLPEGMDRLAQEDLAVTLCLSLHSPDETTRAGLIPAARAFSLKQVMDALRRYVRSTGRRAIIEYALIAGVNDTPADAAKLAALLRGLQAHVNLIPLNDVPESGLKGVTHAQAERFLRQLTAHGVSATIRRTLGADIEGACGQLRRRRMEEKNEE
jgi:23S rRNA (adenine2503-C2)-methyltransferase